MMKTSQNAADLLREGVETFRNAPNREYHELKEEMSRGVERLEAAVEAAEDDGVTDERLEDLKVVRDTASEIADGEKGMSFGRDVADIAEYGLEWLLIEPDECPGYAPEIDEGEFGLQA